MRRLLVDADGAIALHVGVAAHRANAGARPAEIAAQEQEIRDLADRRHRMPMLRDAHRPGADRSLGIEIDLRGLLDLRASQAGLIFDLLPARRIDAGAICANAPVCCARNSRSSTEGRPAASGCIVGGEHRLAHAAHRGHVAAEAHLVVVAGDLRAAAAEHLELVLRIGEALEPALAHRIEHDYLGAALGRLAQVAEHAGMVGARVLAQ